MLVFRGVVQTEKHHVNKQVCTILAPKTGPTSLRVWIVFLEDLGCLTKIAHHIFWMPIEKT